jgi:TonB family protein
MTTQTLAVESKSRIAGCRSTARLGLLVALTSLCLGISLSSSSRAQDAPAKERKLITRIEPQYPATLQRLYIGGIVKLEVVVAPNGAVVSATLIGGNPILGQSAIAAVKQWKYASDTSKTTVTERIEFDPHR